jgi:CBS domain-containing protein
MRVKDLMTAPAATVARGESLHVADGIMSMGAVRHLPVMHGPELVGVVSERDILRAPGLLAPAFGLGVDARAVLKVLRVEDVMSSAVVTIEAEAPVQVAAERLLEHRVGCLPVLDGATLVGIVTTSDLLRAMAGSSQELEAPGGTAAIGERSAAPSLAEAGT